MKKIKNLKILFVLLTTILIFSCSEEIRTEEDSTHQSNIKREKVNFKKFSENKAAFSVYKKLNTISSKTQNNSKAVSLDSLDFEVNFNNGLHLSYADLESYTFPIRRILPNGLLENLVINKQTDGKYYAKLLKYNLTNQEKSDLENENLKTITNPIQTEILGEVNFGNSIESDCGYETVQVITSCGSGEHHGGNIASWGSCTSSTLPSLKTITVAIDCVGNSGGGGGGDGSGGYFGNPFTGGGSTAGGGGGGGGYITPSFPNDLTPTDLYDNGISEPVLDLDYQGKPLYLFYVNLTEQQQQWLNDQTPEIQNSIADYLNLNNVSEESKEFVKNLINEATLDQNPQEAEKKVVLAILFENSDDIFSEEFATTIMPYTNIDISHIPTDYPLANLTISTFLKYKTLRQLNPDWSRGKCVYYAMNEIIHVSLDTFGMVPLLGEVADVVNGVLYIIEGDKLNATLSVASAIPVYGWASTGAKYAIKIKNVNQTAYTVATKVKLVWKVVGNVIQFGDRAQLRKVLGMGASALDPRQAHHIIPWNKQSKSIVQKAAKSQNAFHMNEALNGIPLSTAVHNGSHGNYDNVIQTKFDLFNASNPNATPNECYDFLTDLIQDVRNWIASHPNTPINNIVLP